MKILGFKKYNEINSSMIRIKSKKIDGDEIIYETHLTINGEGIDGLIYCDNDEKLECFQFFNKEGFCLSEIYGEDNINNLIIKKLKKIKK